MRVGVYKIGGFVEEITRGDEISNSLGDDDLVLVYDQEVSMRMCPRVGTWLQHGGGQCVNYNLSVGLTS